MSNFIDILKPTPFGFFDSDTVFQVEADASVTFVKRRLGDDVLSVELTKKQIWACLEEATLEYSSIINQYQAKSQLSSLLGTPTGSLEGSEERYPRKSFDFMMRKAEPYSMEAGLGGSFTSMTGSIDLVKGIQDYDLYTELKDVTGSLLVNSNQNSPKTKMKIMEVYHFSPHAAYRFFDTTSAINYLNNEFSFESFTPETIFYVLPVFEDILRGGQLDLSSRVRRSNYSYRIIGTTLKVFPTPTRSDPGKLWVRVQFNGNPLSPQYNDDSIVGVSNLSNIPYGNIEYGKINSIGRQWIRQFTLSLCMELLGLIRSKFQTIPIPGADLTLNGGDLVTRAREDKEKLKEKLTEMLESLTYNKLLEEEVTANDNLQKLLRAIPIPNGQAIIVG